MNAADRTGPSLDLLPNAVVDASPAFPFRYSPTNGFFAITPALEYTPSFVGCEVIISGVPNDKEVILAVCEADKVMITNKRVLHFPTTWAAGVTLAADQAEYSNPITWNENKKYMLFIGSNDANSLDVDVYEYNGQNLGIAQLSVTTVFSGNPVFHFGFPTDSQIANGGASGGTDVADIDVVPPSTDIVVHATQAENAGPTDISVSPAVATDTWEIGSWIGTLSAAHARTDWLPCTYSLVAGTGDTDNGDYAIRGTNLHSAATLTAGANSIRVEAKDRFGYTFQKALTITVS